MSHPRNGKHAGANADRLPGVVRELVRLVHQRGVGDALAIVHRHSLTLPQVVALFDLREGGPRTVGSIARTLSLSRAATSHLVDRLVRGRLVQRAEDVHDRRQKRISVSDRGKAVLARLDDARRRELDAVIGGLSAQTRAQLTVVLEQVNTQLRGIG